MESFFKPVEAPKSAVPKKEAKAGPGAAKRPAGGKAGGPAAKKGKLGGVGGGMKKK